MKFVLKAVFLMKSLAAYFLVSIRAPDRMDISLGKTDNEQKKIVLKACSLRFHITMIF